MVVPGVVVPGVEAPGTAQDPSYHVQPQTHLRTRKTETHKKRDQITGFKKCSVTDNHLCAQLITQEGKQLFVIIYSSSQRHIRTLIANETTMDLTMHSISGYAILHTWKN